MNIINNLATLILNAGVLQGVFLAILLMGLKKGNTRANRILGILSLLFSANIAHMLLFSNNLSYDYGRHFRINEPFQFLIGPMIYLYIRALSQPALRFAKKDLLHFIPFGIFGCIIMPLNIIHGISGFSSWLRNHADSITTWVWALILLHVTLYILYSIHDVLRYEKRMKASYSDFDRISMRWMKFILRELLALYILNFLVLAWMIHVANIQEPFTAFQKTVCVFMAILVYGLGYHGFQNARIFTQDEETESDQGKPEDEKDADIDTDSPKYERSGLDKSEGAEISKALLAYMEKEKPFLDPDLTLPQLSQMMDLPRNKLSQVLNETLGLNFYDFVNGYRVKEVQTLMTEPKYKEMKLLAIAFDAGFNSKAAFNSVFKKNTGATPSEYRRNLTV